MPIEEVPESGGVPEPKTGESTRVEEREQHLAEEAAEFITSQVLDKGATFFGG